MSVMFQRSSESPLYQSQWWVRLASFSPETDSNERVPGGKIDRNILIHRGSSTMKRGLRSVLRWPLSLLTINR